MLLYLKMYLVILQNMLEIQKHYLHYKTHIVISTYSILYYTKYN